MNRAPGTLILVVGPSGAGKDTLIAGARERLKDDPRFVFPRRVITRAADAGGEDHIAVDPPTFEAMRREGAFALSWDAHGFSYGIPKSIEADLAAGRHVIVNVSRGIAEQTRAFAKTAWIEITADAMTIVERLRSRGREGEREIERRLSAAGRQLNLAGGSHLTFRNDGTVEQGVTAFLGILDLIDRRSLKGG